VKHTWRHLETRDVEVAAFVLLNKVMWKSTLHGNDNFNLPLPIIYGCFLGIGCAGWDRTGTMFRLDLDTIVDRETKSE
jgi:hypothetical protein